MLRIIIILLIAIPFGLRAQAPPLSAPEYIEKFKVLAVQEMIEYKIPASITLAQGLVETGNGNSNLARLANNHFGIKCHVGWTGPTYYQDDDTVNECFRKYDDPAQSYRDHSLFLTGRPRYTQLFMLQLTDYEGWARGLKAAGYATNPNYADHLIKVILEFNLQYFDTLTSIPGHWASTPLFVDNLDNQIDQGWEREEEFVLHPASEYKIRTFNKIRYTEAKTGDTPTQIAENLDLMAWQVCLYNNVERNHVFRTGERVYLQPKRSRGNVQTHTVEEGETMWEISQVHGILLHKIYSYNNLVSGTQPEPGTVLSLVRRK